MTNIAKPSEKSRPFSGITGHASMAAMTGARSLTSHARKHYHEKYRGRYRHAPLVYLFDVFLVSMALVLFIFDLYWFLHATFVASSGLTVAFQTPSITASEAVPVLAEIRATDGRIHEGVQVHWNLPDWVEVVRMEPQANAHGDILLGAIHPGDPRTVRAIIRVRASVGDEVPISLSIRQLDPLGSERFLNSTQIREVKEASLHFSPLLQAHRVVSGASVPYVIENGAKLPVEALRIRLTSAEGAPDAHFEGGSSELILGRLNPEEKRIVWVELGEVTADHVRAEFELIDGAQAVAVVMSVYAVSRETPTVRLIAPLEQTKTEALVRVSATASGSLLIQHPAGVFTNGLMYGLFPVDSGEKRFAVSLTNESATSRWRAVPVSGTDADAVIGRALSDLLGVPVQAAAKFYSVSGDQIGVGPNPPIVGQTTRYWIAWTVGPLGGELRDVDLHAELPAGVVATGNSVSPTEESLFTSEGQTVRWTAPSLSLSGDDVATFAFEVMATPTEEQAGSVLPLVGVVTIKATDVESGTEIETSVDGDDSRLRFDEKAASDGVVRK